MIRGCVAQVRAFAWTAWHFWRGPVGCRLSRGHLAAAGHSSYQVVNRVAPIVRLQAGQVQVDDFVLDTSGMGKQVSSCTSCGSAAGKRCLPTGQGGRVVLSHRPLPCVPAHPFSTHMLPALYRRAAVRQPSGSVMWMGGATMMMTGSRVSFTSTFCLLAGTEGMGVVTVCGQRSGILGED